MRTLTVVALLMLAGLPAPGPAAANEGDVTRQAIAELRGASAAATGLALRVDMTTLSAFYAGRDDRPLWLADDAARASKLIARLRRADREGLRPDAYRPEMLAERLSNDTAPRLRAELELLLSGALLRYAADLRQGRLSPQQVDPALPAEATGPSPTGRTILAGAAKAANLDAYLDGLAPATPIYRRLRRALSEYRRIAAAGGWPTVPAGPSLKPGMSDPRVATLRARLKAGGDMTTHGSGSNVFDAALEQAVRRFQARHGLDADGVVGAQTLAALDVPVQTRIRQIEINMERWRWMPDDLGERYVLVNLAGFEVELVESGSVQLEMRAVVGKPYRKTPVFSGQMTYLEFNPTWTVPPTILSNDVVPKLRVDPGYLARENMTLYGGWSAEAPALDPAAINWAAVDPKRLPYRVVQAPGPKNALGLVKFMFPNRYHVYLHDSPARELFRRTVRTFSSGCIRVEKPLDLAEALLSDKPGWDRRKIDETIASGRTTRVLLPEPLPVHLTYSTVWIGEGGTVHFRDDVYGRDLILAQALSGQVMQ